MPLSIPFLLLHTKSLKKKKIQLLLQTSITNLTNLKVEN